MQCACFKKSKVLVILLISLFALCLFPALSYADGGFPIIAVLHAGSNPEGIAVDTSTHMVYIAYEYPSFVVGFDPIQGKVRWRVSIGNVATDVQVDSTNHYVYVVGSQFSGKQGLLAVLDGATGRILFTTPTVSGDAALAVDLKRHLVYVSSSETATIDAFTLLPSAAGKFQAELSTLTFGKQPQALGVNSRLGRLYVGDGNTNTVTVYDEDKGRILASIPVADVPEQPLRVDEATGRIYVVCSRGQELDVINGYKNTILARVPVSPYPEGVAFNTATGRIYVADEGNIEGSFTDSGTTITVIDGQSFNVLGTLQVGHGPDGVEADPLLRRVYVSVEDSNAVAEISDSVDLPLQSGVDFHQTVAAHSTIGLLRGATIITVVIMLLTMIGATLGVLLPRWHVRGSLQTPPGDGLSH